MNRINQLIAIFFSLALLAGSGVSVADCKQKHSKGTWRIQGLVWAVNGNDETESFVCKLKVGSSGAISGSKSTCKTFTDGNVNVTGGKLKLSKSCAVSGNVKTAGGQVNIRSGHMDRSRNSFTTVAVDSQDANFEYLLNGIKQ